MTLSSSPLCSWPQTDVTAPGSLLAVLCNPALKDHRRTITWKNVAVLAECLGTSGFAIENLIEVPTKSTTLLAPLAGCVDVDQLELRLERAAYSSTVAVVAWGTGSPPGWSRSQWRALTGVASSALRRGGHRRVLQIGGAPRHPSRWRQHTSPVHERYRGDSFPERLKDALSWIHPEDLLNH